MPCAWKRFFFALLAVFGILVLGGTSPAFSESRPGGAHGFDQCGRYRLRGKLVLSPAADTPVVYRVNEGTRSQLEFRLSSSEDLAQVSAHLDQPTELEADIAKPLDGTQGELSGLGAVRLRFPDPLRPDRDGGIMKLTPLDCRK